MSKPERKKRQPAQKPRAPRRPSVRDGGTHLSLFNSGLEVWLYDDANTDTIRATGAMNFVGGGEATESDEPFESIAKRGLIAGYSLHQDDELEVAVYVGAPLSDAELAAARWLEPQTAFLRLPSGTLRVEPNDSCRVGAEEPTDEGGVVTVPPGDYRVTLYRIDHEALFRERLEWNGAQEVIVLTPGGTSADAASDLLPFQPRRDTSWVGRYEVSGNRATALAWFGDYWDTCILNLDSAAIKALSLVPGSYIRTHVPAAGVTLISAFGETWTDARRLPPPTGVPLDEFGYAALSPMGEWGGAEAIFCRRDTAKTRIENEHHDVWLPATVDVLDPVAHAPAPPKPKVGGLTPTDLASKVYFDPGFLSLILSDVLPEVGDLDELPLPDAIQRLDAKLAKMTLVPQGDFEWNEQSLHGDTERSCRLYAGQPDTFAAIVASEGCFDLLFVSALEDGRWTVTGLADDFESRLLAARHRGVSNEAVEVESIDDALKTIASAHAKRLRAEKGRVVAPTTLTECATVFELFLRVAFG